MQAGVVGRVVIALDDGEGALPCRACFSLEMCTMLEGKVAVVTGAGGGIGRAIAIALADAGAAVVVNDVGVSLTGEGGSATPAEETRDLILARGGCAIINTDSVSNWHSAQRIVACALEQFGSLHIVVNNAGILRDAYFHEMSPDEWTAVIDVHLHGCFYVSRAAADVFKQQESGSYIHMTSTSGLIGNNAQANYSAAKMGVVGLSKAIALDMQRYNVRSNCVAPFAWGRMLDSINAQRPDQITNIGKLRE